MNKLWIEKKNQSQQLTRRITVTFRKGNSVQDHMFIVKQIIEK